MPLLDLVVLPSDTSPRWSEDYILALQTFLGPLTPSGLSRENVAEAKAKRPDEVRDYNGGIALDLQRAGRALFVGQLLAERCAPNENESIVAAILAHALLTTPR
jgi:hypothetical protein